MTMIWLFFKIYLFKQNTEISPIGGFYGIKIESFVRVWPMKLLAWCKKFNTLYTVASPSAGAG